MARDDQQGEMPAEHSQEWRDVREALGRAQDMAANAVQKLRILQQRPMRPRSWPADPRLATRPSALQLRVRSLLTTHFRLRNPGPFDILNLTDGYRRIHQRLLGLDRKSFRMVTASVANEVAETGNGDTFGYVRPEEPNTIYLNDGYFSLDGGTQPSSNGSLPGSTISRSRHSVVEAGGDSFHIRSSLPVRASVVLHEAVHLTYGAAGAVHLAINSGASISIGFQDCRTGYTQIITVNQAMGDAYVWERFARCVYTTR